MPFNKIAAILVHILTASGVLCSLMSLLAITDHAVERAFMWLGLALLIDAVDGPLARLVDTKTNLARFSGERLDLIVDYLNFVFLPAFLLVEFPLISGQWGLLAASMMLMTSLYHFSDVSSKTEDGYFVGFPAIWNVVVFYLLAFDIDDVAAFIIVLILSLLTFVPIKWLHPFRVHHMRVLTGFVVLVWLGAAFLTVLAGFETGFVEKGILIGAAIYLVALSLKRNINYA